MRLYLEPSVLVKIFKVEENSDKMINLIDLINEREEWAGYTSKWTLLEVARALRKDGKPKEVILLDLDELRRHKITFVSISDEILERAGAITASRDMYASDALHIATFESLEREKLEGFLSDDKHYRRLREIVPVLRLRELALPSKI